jgi:hypothetical protein
MAATLADVLKDPNYVNANAATKAAIFDKFSANDSNYTNANDATKLAIRTKFGVQAPTLTPVAPVAPVAPAADAIPKRDLIKEYGYPALEATLGTVGSIVGGAGGTVLGGPIVGTAAGGLAGGGLGYAAAKEIEKLYEEQKGTRKPVGLTEGLSDAAKNVLTGAAYEAGGRIILPPVAKAAGWVWDRASGKLIQIKAGKIVQELAGPNLEAIKAAASSAPKNLTAGQAIAGVDAAPLQALGAKAVELKPYVYGPVEKAQQEEAKNMLRGLAKGGTATEAKIAQSEAKNALNANLIPTLTTELNAANIAGQELPRLQGEANRFGQAATNKVEDVRRFTAASERAGERAANTVPVLGQPRVPGRYTYMGDLEKQAEKVAANAAEGSLAFGEASRFAQQAADSLASHGLKPLKSDAIVSAIARKSSDPEFAGNDIIEGALKNVADDIAKWTSKGGVIDAWALDSIRKNSVNAAVRKLNPSMDQTQQKNLAAEVITQIKPVIINAIESAGGTGYGKYLSDYAVGRQAIAQTKLGAKAMQLFKDSPDKFINLVEGNSPEVVEKVFGKGSYNIAKEMSAQAYDTLRNVATGVSRSKEMAEQASRGAGMFREVLGENLRGYDIPNILDPKVAVANKSINILRSKVNKKTADMLYEGMRSGQSLNTLLNTLPTAQRNAIYQAMQKDPALQSLVSQSVNALAQ